MTFHVLPRRVLGMILTLALGLTLLPGLPARAQTTTWADLDPWEIAVGYTTPFEVGAFAWDTTWDSTTSVAVLDDMGVEVSGAAGNVTVTDTSNLTFDLLVSLGEGSYTVQFTTGDEVALASLWILAPYASLDPSALGEGYAGPQTVAATGTATTWDASTTVDIYHVDPETSVETLVSGAASVAGVSDATNLTMTLEAGLEAGSYLARFTTGTDTADAHLFIATPSVSLSPGLLPTGATAATPFEAWGTWTHFEEGQTTLEILDPEGTAISGAAGSLVVHWSDNATFELLVDLPVGTYTARFTTGTQVADGTFDVAAPSVSLSHGWFEEGYASTPVDAYGMFTSFDGTTQVVVLDTTGTEVGGAVSELVVENAEWLSFTLASLPGGDYTVRITTGSEVVSDTFTVQGPEIYVHPAEIEGSYATPYTVWVDGYLTDFAAGSTSVAVLDAATRGPIAGVVDNVVVDSEWSLTFDLAGTPLPEGDYLVQVTTATQTLEAPFSVVPPTPYMHLDPWYLPADYTAPHPMTVTGYHTHFDGTTTVEVGTYDWETDTFTPISGAAGSPTVSNATHLTFDLETVLDEGEYEVRITTGSETVSEWFYVERSIAADPHRVPVSYSAPQFFQVWGTGTSFQQGTTVVDILDDAASVIPSAAGNISVTDTDYLSFDLLAELAEGTYTIRVTTGSEVEETIFDVTRWMDLEPWQLPVDHAVGEVVTATGFGTTFTQGTTVVTIEDQWGVEVAGAVGTVTVNDATSLTFELATSLPEDQYTVRATTGSEIVEGGLEVTRWIEVDPSFLDTGYATPQPMTVNGFGTSFSDGVTTVEVIDWFTDMPVDGAVAAGSVSVTSTTGLTFDLALSLPEDSYYVRVTTGDEIMYGHLSVWNDTSPPWAHLDPSMLPSDHAVPTTIQVHGSNTSFAPTSTIVEILDSTGTPRASAVGAVSVSNASHLTFELTTQLPYGTHDVRITTGDEVVLTSLHVVDPWAWASPSLLSVGYPSTTIGVTGGHTSFQDGITTVVVVDDGDVVQAGAVTGLTVAGTTSLSFTLASGLTAGYYRIVVTTGSEVVEAFLWIRQPTISLNPSYLDAGYSTPKTVEVYGSGTSFDSSTSVELHGSAGAIAGVVGAPSVLGPNWLTFPVEQPLVEGSYRVRVTTGSEVVEAPFHVVQAKATTSSSTGSTSVDPATGEVTVSMPVGTPSDLTLTTTPTCADSSTPTAAALVHNGKTYAMSPVGDGTWVGTIPAAELTNGDIGTRVTCGGTTTDEKVGTIVLYDPAGNVTNSATGEPVVGATVTLFKVPGWMPKQSADDTTPDTCQSHHSKDPEDPWSDTARTDLGVQVDASSPEIDPNLNPQTTNSVGRYGWFTAEGCWYVVVSKEGYVTQTSPMVGVPPEVTDLDISLVPVPDATNPTWPGAATMTSSALGETQVSLSWPAASDDTSVDSYQVLRDGVPVATTAGTSFTVTGLSPATGYTFSVKAIDPSGNTADGPAVAVTTVDLTAPAWPTEANLTASNVTETALTLAWTAATDNVGVTGYRVFQDGTSIGTAAAGVRSLDVTGLAAGTTYAFRVEAFDAAANESTAGPVKQVKTTSTDTGGTDGGTTDGGTTDGGTTDGGATDGGTTDGTTDGGTTDGGTTDGGTTGDGSQMPQPGTVQRLAGIDRYATAAAISSATFDPGVPVVYIATGSGFPDALAGGPAAAATGGPILLTTKDAIPTATDAELTRLRPGRIVILGGELVVSSDVGDELESYTAGAVTRLAGENRYETAAAISAATYGPDVRVVYIATGGGFSDALAGGATAGRDGGPVLLVSKDTIPEATAGELERLSPDQIIVLGGEAVVSPTVADQLGAYTAGAVTRLAGDDRYETAVGISASFAPGVPVVYVATGLDFPDALAGVPAAGIFGAPILLVPGDHIPQVVADELTRLKPAAIRALGGSAVVSDTVVEQLRGLVAG